MPGIQIAVFQGQVEQLMLAFTRPTDFLRQLTAIFERYGLPAHRSAEGKQQLPEPAYHLPILVLREIETHLPALCAENPGAALRLGDALSTDRYTETRLLGAQVLGLIPAHEAEAVITRLKSFCDAEENSYMQRIYLWHGSACLRRESPLLWLEKIESWIRTNTVKDQNIGLRALFSVVEDKQFENLPPVFRLLEPFLQNVKREQEALLRTFLEALADRTPTETAYYLFEIAPYITDDRSQRLLRSCLPLFSTESQTLIRRGMAEARKTP